MISISRLLAIVGAAFLLCATSGAAQAQLARDEVVAIFGALTSGAEQGLPAKDIEKLGADLQTHSPERQAAAQVRLVNALYAYAAAQHGARLMPSAVDKKWALNPETFDAPAGFAIARATNNLNEWLASLPPPQKGYANLVAAFRRYNAIEAAGGWPVLEDTHLQAGDSGAAVEALRERLRIEGYDVTSATPDIFDAPLKSALAMFQKSAGVAPDGIAGPLTLAALNITAADRVGQMAVNLERYRWLPRMLPARRIEVNLPTQTLVLFEEDKPALTMRVVIGTKANATPSFQSAISAVVINPSWTVPNWIANGEILPRAVRDPDYLSRNGYSRKAGSLVQAPGPGNALGRVKFDMPNPFGVYFHDTPAKSLFARDDRRFSHGCVRLEAPRELATRLLSDQGWTVESVDAAIAQGRTQRVALSQPIAIFSVYQTAFVDDAGNLFFAPDVYGWDAELNAALASRGASLNGQATSCEAMVGK